MIMAIHFCRRVSC